jgi:hypothetical protein
MDECEARTQGAFVAALRTRPRTTHRARPEGTRVRTRQPQPHFETGYKPVPPGTSSEQASLASLGPESVSLLTALWSCPKPATAGHLARLTGMDRSEVAAAVAELRTQGLVRTLNTVIESYVPSGARD